MADEIKGKVDQNEEQEFPESELRSMRLNLCNKRLRC
jgi:hypothetical protein